MILAREMPVLAAARIISITDQRLWCIIEHYIGQAIARLADSPQQYMDRLQN